MVGASDASPASVTDGAAAAWRRLGNDNMAPGQGCPRRLPTIKSVIRGKTREPEVLTSFEGRVEPYYYRLRVSL